VCAWPRLAKSAEGESRFFKTSPQTWFPRLNLLYQLLDGLTHLEEELEETFGDPASLDKYSTGCFRRARRIWVPNLKELLLGWFHSCFYSSDVTRAPKKDRAAEIIDPLCVCERGRMYLGRT
jgi:hypothetical protein